MAAAPEGTVLGAPGEPRFDSSPVAEVILLGLTDDWEAELEFAHATQLRERDAHWILLGDAAVAEDALRLFDTLHAKFLPYPPPAEKLRASIRGSRHAGAPALSARTCRLAIRQRFSRWFSDLELPELLRALDPRLADIPTLIRGEPGTGRNVLAHYIHMFGGTSNGTFVHLPCGETTTAEEILDALSNVGRGGETPMSVAIWLEEVERLPVALQAQLREWIECAPPPGVVRAPLLRWIGTTGDSGSGREPEPGLRRALSGLCIRLAPLRERPELVSTVASEVTRLWCGSRRLRARRFGEDAIAVMEEYPWPGNLRELEAVVVQTLAAGSSDPVRSDDLQYDGHAFSPLGASEVGALIVDEGEAEHPLHQPHAQVSRPEPQPEQPASIAPTEQEVRRAAESGTAGREPGERSDPPVAEASLARIVASLSHEVRNPLATIRTFASLLPERFNDPEFRSRFTEVVTQDIGRIDALVEQLGRLADLQAPKRETLDVSALLEQLLDEREETIRRRKLLVLKELDMGRSIVTADRAQLRFAFEVLLGKSLDLVPDRGDVYLASRRHDGGPGTKPSVRILVRFHDPDQTGAGAASSGASIAEHSLELTIAELVIRAQRGSFALTTTEGKETVIVIDLPVE